MRAFKYFLGEAAASLWRGRKAAVLSILTIAGGLFVLGFFLVLNANLQRLVGRWTESAELSVYLKDDVTPDQLKMVDDLIGGSGLAAAREYVSKNQAIDRFKQDFPDLAGATTRLESNPFPASFEIRLKPEVRDAGGAVDNLATTLSGIRGVADVRYDRRWLTRLNSVVRLLRSLGLGIILLLALASALTVANVVRLAASAREDEIEIMTLVGAPLEYVRGPFVVEGVLQGGVGALVAMLVLWFAFAAANARFGTPVAQAVGLGAITFLPLSLSLLIVLGGMLLGCLGGLIVARGVRSR
jgi:cell division transport system permease protein